MVDTPVNSDSHRQILALDIPCLTVQDGEVVDFGAGLNALRAAIRATPDSASELKTVYVSIVGDDSEGVLLEREALALVSSAYVISQIGIRTLRNNESASSSTVSEQLSMQHFYASPLLLDDHLLQVAAQSRYIFYPGSLLTQLEGIDVLIKLGYHLNKGDRGPLDCKCVAATLGGEKVISGNKTKLEALLPFIDFIFGTEADTLVYADVYFGDARMTPQAVASYLASLPKVCTARPRVVVIYRNPQPTIVATVGTIFEVPIVSTDPFNSLQDLALDSFVGGFIGCLRSAEERFEIMKYNSEIKVYNSDERPKSIQRDTVRRTTQQASVRTDSLSKHETSEFYYTKIFPKKGRSLLKSRFADTNSISDTPQLVPCLCSGTKALTECVNAGQYAALNCGHIFAMNSKASFYGNLSSPLAATKKTAILNSSSKSLYSL